MLAHSQEKKNETHTRSARMISKSERRLSHCLTTTAVYPKRQSKAVRYFRVRQSKAVGSIEFMRQGDSRDSRGEIESRDCKPIHHHTGATSFPGHPNLVNEIDVGPKGDDNEAASLHGARTAKQRTKGNGWRAPRTNTSSRYVINGRTLVSELPPTPPPQPPPPLPPSLPPSL